MLLAKQPQCCCCCCPGSLRPPTAPRPSPIPLQQKTSQRQPSLHASRQLSSALLPQAASADAVSTEARPSSQQSQPAAEPHACSPSQPEAAQASQEPRYLSYQDYVAMQARLAQEQQSLAEQRADETAHASSSAPSPDSSGKRVPWNKGRKHSAMTIARITEGTARALARPEVKAKLDAWNQSRIGSKTPEHIKAKIAEKQRAAMAARRENMSEEELAAYTAKRSALAKRLWQDPGYAAKTLSAIQEAGERRRQSSAQQAADADGDGTSSSSSGSSRRGGAGSSTKSRRRAAASSSSGAAEVGVEGQAAAKAERPVTQQPRRPSTQTKKVMAAEARMQLQAQLDKLLHTQHVIAQTEQTVQQLRGSLAAFENNPQAKEQAAATLQRAESNLGPARRLVSKLATSLQDHGVHWDASTGLMTHINNEPLEQFLRAGGGKARNTSNSGSGSSSSSSSSSSTSRPASGDPAGSRSGSSRAGASSSSSGGGGSSSRAAAGPGAPDVVRSSRGVQADAGSSELAGGFVVSSRRRGAVAPVQAATLQATAAAAAGGGTRVSGAWTPLSSMGAVVPGVQNGNGRNSHGGAQYMPVQVAQQPGAGDGDEEDE